MRLLFVVTISFVLAAGCSSKKAQPDPVPEAESAEKTSEPATMPETAAEPGAAPQTQPGASQGATDEAIAARVADAKKRLSATAEGKVVWESIERHGGLEAWFEKEVVDFRFDYRPKEGTRRNTQQQIDLWSSRARHQTTDGAEFGWTGSKAWISPADSDPGVNARFWALTPYYFVAVPFVLGDPGIQLEDAGAQEFEGTMYDTIKVTFEDGVGDAPDDYYVVYFDPESRRVGGLRYVVSYPGFFPDGGHSPEKFMAYDGELIVDGITFAETYRTFEWDGESEGDVVTETTLSNVSFKPLDSAHFSAPENAKIIEGY